jgi:hypothetical protein
MSISRDKTLEHATEIRASIHDLQLGNVLAEVKRTVRKYRATTGNDTLAIIAWDAFCDGCEGWDVPIQEDVFNRFFPEYAGGF